MKKTFRVSLAALFGAIALGSVLPAQQPRYVQTRKGDHVDTYDGRKVPDPYRWLEEDTSAETAAWVEAQNKVTFPYLQKIPFRDQLQKRVRALNDYEKYTAPSRKGPYVFFRKNDGLQNQSVLYIQKGIDGQAEVLIDPNAWSPDGTVQLSAFVPSKDAKYAVYGISRSGSDWQEYKVMELATKKTLPDTIQWVKVSGAAWHGDGFYYSRYPAPEAGKDKASINENHQVYFHKVSTPQSQDVLVYEDTNNPQRFHIVETTEDERFAILNISDRGKGKDGNAVFVRDLSNGETTFKPVIGEIGNDSFGVLDNVGGELLIQTNYKTPNWRVIKVDPARPQEANWTDVLPEKPEPLQDAGTAGGKLFATYLKDVTTRAYVYDLAGKLEHEVKLPGLGVAGGFGGPIDAKDVFYTFNSLTVPPTIFRYDIASQQSSVFRQPKVPGYDSTQYETKQVFYPSKDGTKIPMFIVHKKGLKLDGEQPDAALCVRRLQRRPVAHVQRRAPRDPRTGSRLCVSQYPRRRRVRRAVASAGNEAEEAERIRRLHRRGRVADRQQVHVGAEARDSGRIERRSARGRRDEPAPGSLRRGDPAGGRHGHAAVPQVHDRLELDRRLRLQRQPGGVQGALRVFTAAQHQEGREVPCDAHHDGRP